MLLLLRFRWFFLFLLFILFIYFWDACVVEDVVFFFGCVVELAGVLLLQVGSYFIEQYYRILHQQPGLVYQFYTDASTVLRVDGAIVQSATAMRVVLFFLLFERCSRSIFI